MQTRTLPEKRTALASLLALGIAGGTAAGVAGCSADHHVSPWAPGGPSLGVFLRPPDIAAELARTDAEARALGLVRTEEILARLPPPESGLTAVLRGYEGRDLAGRKVHAVRVATPYGVVLAVGPLDAGDLDRTTATELVPILPEPGDPVGSGAVYRSGTDLNADGSVDVVLRNDAGVLAIWRIGARGSGPYAVDMIPAPTRGFDADGDARLDLWGQLPAAAGDPIAPRLTDIATFSGKTYSDGTPGARAWHAREAASPLPTGVTDTVRLRAIVEHAWHAILSGEPRENVLHALSGEPVPAPLRPWFEGHRRRLAGIRAPGPG
jgi:hypothetical protein